MQIGSKLCSKRLREIPKYSESFKKFQKVLRKFTKSKIFKKMGLQRFRDIQKYSARKDLKRFGEIQKELKKL